MCIHASYPPASLLLIPANSARPPSTTIDRGWRKCAAWEACRCTSGCTRDKMSHRRPPASGAASESGRPAGMGFEELRMMSQDAQAPVGNLAAAHSPPQQLGNPFGHLFSRPCPRPPCPPVRPSHLAFAQRMGQPSADVSQKATASLKQDSARTAARVMCRQQWLMRRKWNAASASHDSERTAYKSCLACRAPCMQQPI